MKFFIFHVTFIAKQQREICEYHFLKTLVCLCELIGNDGNISLQKENLYPDEFSKDEEFSLPALPPIPPSYFDGILSLNDLEHIDPTRYS